MNHCWISRRDLLSGTALAGCLVLADGTEVPAATESLDPPPTPALVTPPSRQLPNLAPARWIWYPSGRTLANTFILFRRVLELPRKPRRATGWIAADSRYLLRSQRPARPVGAGAVRPALAGGRSRWI